MVAVGSGSRGVYALGFGLHAVVYVDEVGYGLAGVCHLYQCGLDFLLGLEGIVDKHDAAFCGVDVMLVFVVGQETDATGAAFFYLGEIGNSGLWVSNDGSPDKSCYHLCAEFHVNALGLNFKVLRVFKVFKVFRGS